MLQRGLQCARRVWRSRDRVVRRRRGSSYLRELRVEVQPRPMPFAWLVRRRSEAVALVMGRLKLVSG